MILRRVEQSFYKWLLPIEAIAGTEWLWVEFEQVVTYP